MKQALVNGRVFDGEKTTRGAAVILDGETIASIHKEGDLPDGVDTVVDLGGNLLSPGLVDLQVNGGGGRLFNDSPDEETLRIIAAAHRRFGTTAMLATIVSDTADIMRRGLRAVDTAIRNGAPGIRGIHLEGPHLDIGFRGVHDEAKIRQPDESSVELMLTPICGQKMVTLAPETVPTDLIRRLRAAGIVVCGGHSSASYEETRQALEAGLDGFTHLFNAMTQLNSRAPGMVGAALEDSESFAGIIADGFHVHPSMLRLAVRSKAAGKVVLVSDAMPSVGSDDKQFKLNGQTITADAGRCLTANGRLAGADIGMIDAVRNMVRFGGADLSEALRMASSYPAEAVHLADRIGYIRPGYAADLIELDPDLSVRRSWIGGDCAEFGKS